MTATNQFLKFADDGLANVMDQADYLADSQRTLGQQPGLARAELNNKALRQATFVVSCLAQAIANKFGLDMLDDGDSATMIDTFEDLIEAGFLVQSSFTIVNNQSSAADITGLIFDHTVIRAATIYYVINRRTTAGGATELTEGGTIQLTYDVGAGTWRLVDMPAGPDDSGVTFSVDAATGQVKYVSTNITGTASVSQMLFKSMILEVP